MKRSLIVLGTLLVALYLGSVPASAQRGSRPTSPGMSGTSHSSTSHDSSNTAGKSTNTSPVLPGNTSTALVKALGNSGITTIPGTSTSITSASLAAACSGFKNTGRCIAAIHVAHNLGGNCTFAALKTTATSQSGSLGKAIQGCDPHADPKAEASKAIKQANAEIKNAKS